MKNKCYDYIQPLRGCKNAGFFNNPVFHTRLLLLNPFRIFCRSQSVILFPLFIAGIIFITSCNSNLTKQTNNKNETELISNRNWDTIIKYTKCVQNISAADLNKLIDISKISFDSLHEMNKKQFEVFFQRNKLDFEHAYFYEYFKIKDNLLFVSFLNTKNSTHQIKETFLHRLNQKSGSIFKPILMTCSDPSLEASEFLTDSTIFKWSFKKAWYDSIKDSIQITGWHSINLVCMDTLESKYIVQDSKFEIVRINTQQVDSLF